MALLKQTKLYQTNCDNSFEAYKRRLPSGNTRTRQLLLKNQKMLNSLASCDAQSSQNTNLFSDFASNKLDSSRIANIGQSHNTLLLKRPFKHHIQRLGEENTKKESLKQDVILSNRSETYMNINQLQISPQNHLMVHFLKIYYNSYAIILPFKTQMK